MELLLDVFGFLVRPRFLALFNTPLLWQYKDIDNSMDGTTSSSAMNFLIQPASFAASHVATYSAFVVESVVFSCLELFQLIAPPLQTNINLDIDFLSFISN